MEVVSKPCQVYLCELDHDEVLEFGQVGRVALVLDGALVVDLGNELRLLDVRVEVKGIMPVLERKKNFR